MSKFDSGKLDAAITNAGWSEAQTKFGLRMYYAPVSTMEPEKQSTSSSFKRARTAMKAVVDGALTQAAKRSE